jgi:hypothetical protein
MSEERVGWHVERHTSEDGKQHWNLCLRDLPSMVLQIFEAGWTECLYRVDIREFPEWTVAVIRDSRWRTSPGVSSREPTSWPRRSVGGLI